MLALAASLVRLRAEPRPVAAGVRAEVLMVSGNVEGRRQVIKKEKGMRKERKEGLATNNNNNNDDVEL